MVRRGSSVSGTDIVSTFSRWIWGQQFPSWSVALIGIIIIKATLLLALKPGSFVVSYSAISYFFLLVLATGFAISNGIKNTLGGRIFWVFLATGCGLWSLHQSIYLFYELGLHVEVPEDSIADPLLFLHIVPFIGAVATFPHRNLERKPYRAMLDFVILLCFWSFIYGYGVFPSEYLASPGNYGTRFDLVYLLENLALVLAAGLLTLRALSPWRSVYLHLFGASALYALSSAVANIAIDSGGYANGKLYGLGLTASVCWFVWIPLRARQLSGAELRATRSSSGSQASAWAMLMVMAISIPIVWELFRREHATAPRTFRMVVAIVILACAAYLKEHLAKDELLSRVGLADSRLRLAMESGNSVGWEWDIKSGRDSWFGDLKSMFGIPSDSYVGRVEDFHRPVFPQDRERVAKAVKDAMNRHQPYEAEFRVVRLDGNVRWVAAKGTFYYAKNGDPERMLGIAVDITERKLAEESKERFRSVFECSAVGMALVGHDGRWIQVNRALCEMLGYSEQELLATNFQSLSHPDDLEADLSYAQKVFTGQLRFYHMEKRYIHKQGHVVWVTLTASAVPDASGKVSYGIAQVQDITARKNAEATLRRDQEELHSLAGRLITVQEEERKRIARDLHDDLSQRLALLCVDLDLLRHGMAGSTEAARELERIRGETEQLVLDVRRLSHNEHHPQLDLGLQHGVASFCHDFSRQHGVTFKLISEGDTKQIPEVVCFTLFRVFQEAMSNVAKHSGADRVTVTINVTGDRAVLRVTDQGRGFVIGNQGGLGLISMRERLRLVGGTMRVNSSPFQGTDVEAVVPILTSSGVVSASV
jgi:PAS domain S-box-containing protein